MEPSLKILYVGPLDKNNSSLYRLWALERLGMEVVPMDALAYWQGSRLALNIRGRLIIGPTVARFNRDVLTNAMNNKVDAVWSDKATFLRPATLRKLRTAGIATVNYTIDNPFGPRRDPGWRVYMKAIPEYDLHVVQRDKNVVDYKARGARNVVKIQTAYEPTVHFPPPEDWSDVDRDREVSFIGTPYDQRAEFLTALWREDGVPVVINGPVEWNGKLGAEAQKALYLRQGELFFDEYRESIWRSKINLSFLTHSNQDEFAHKSFEIAACGGFLLAERSQGHMDRFKENEEAVFFSGREECAEKIRKYLPDAAVRERIARAGQRRAVESGYSNDGQVGRILHALDEIVKARDEKARR
jgi:spore maturation protein CgeB